MASTCAYCQTSAQNSVALGDGQFTARIEFMEPYSQTSSGGVVRVSGTESNFSVDWIAVAHDPAVVTVLQTKVWIGNEALTLPPDFDGGTVRFAPTHFPDSEGSGGFPTVKWEVTARLQCSAHNIDDTRTVSVELAFDPWNKAVVYGTAIGSNGQTNASIAIASSGITGESSGRLGAHGHTVSPSGNKLTVSKTTVVSLLGEVTCYIASAHGDPSGVNDSFGWQQQPSQYLAFSSDIASPLSPRDGNGVPRFRYALLYSCSTLVENTATPWPSFNPEELGGVPRDSVYCGFEKVVQPVLAPGITDEWVDLYQINVSLSEHAKKLFAHWAGDAGTSDDERIIGRALAYANTQMMPRGLPVADNSFPSGFKCEAIPMKSRGDVRTTLRRVYLTEAEQEVADIADEPTFWYYVWNN
ncbi:MAG: hypothetical protein AB7F50_05995 [Fimbriimonadaceae bacterium]